MKRSLKFITCAISAFMLALPLGACGGNEHTHTYSDEWSSDATYHWHQATCEHKDEVADKGEHTYEDGVCTVCGKEQPSGGVSDGGDFLGSECVISHAEGTSVSYIFEAECTDLRSKEGPGQSGNAADSSMAQGGYVGLSGGGCVNFLYAEGMSMNFIIASDRDVTDAELTLRVGGEFMNVLLDPTTYTIRVDSVSEEDIDEEDGAMGNWDSFFLDYYTTGDGKDDPDHTMYTIDTWDCEEIHVDASSLPEAGGFTDFIITTELSLKKGLNCISLITSNSELPKTSSGDPVNGTYAAVAPVVDCIKIKTTAQLGMYGQRDNGQGTVGCKIA